MKSFRTLGFVPVPVFATMVLIAGAFADRAHGQVTAKEYLDSVVEIDLVASALAGTCPSWRVSEQARTAFSSQAVQAVADSIGQEKALKAWARANQLTSNQRASIVIEYMENNGLAELLNSDGTCGAVEKLNASDANFRQLFERGR